VCQIGTYPCPSAREGISRAAHHERTCHPEQAPTCHSELVSESNSSKMLKQVQHDMLAGLAGYRHQHQSKPSHNREEHNITNIKILQNVHTT